MGYGNGNENRENNKYGIRFTVTMPVSSNVLRLRNKIKDGNIAESVHGESEYVTFSSETGFVTVAVPRNLLELGG
jgi:hypothetical protein